MNLSADYGSASIALGPAPRAELLHVLMLPDFERADRIGEFWSYPESRAFAELLIDCEEDRTLRAVLTPPLVTDSADLVADSHQLYTSLDGRVAAPADRLWRVALTRRPTRWTTP